MFSIYDAQVRFVLDVFWFAYALRLVFVFFSRLGAAREVTAALSRRFSAATDAEKPGPYRGPPGAAQPRSAPFVPEWSVLGLHLLPPAWTPLWFPGVVTFVAGQGDPVEGVPSYVCLFLYPTALIAGRACRKACEVAFTPAVELASRWRWAAHGSAAVGVVMALTALGLHGSGGLTTVCGPWGYLLALASLSIAVSARGVATKIERAGVAFAPGVDGASPPDGGSAG